MAEDVKYFRLGLFTLVSIGLLVAGIALLGVMDYFRPTVTLETYFLSQSVRGLEVGAPVKFLGVTAGKVTEIASAGLVYHRDEILDALRTHDFAQLAGPEFRSAILVRMEIVPQEGLRDIGDLRRDLFQAMVDMGFRARLAQSGLAGPLFVDLEYLDPGVYPVPELPWKPRDFFVPSAPGALSEFTTAATSILNQLRKADFTETFEKLDQSFQALNKFAEEIDPAEIRTDLFTLAEEFRQAGFRLREFLSDPRLEQTLTDLSGFASGTAAALKNRGEDLSSTLDTIPRTAAHLEQVTARTERLLDDERIDRILEGMSQAADRAGGTMENTEATTAELRRLVRELSRLTMILNEDLSVITANLRRITEDAEVITEELRDNPSRLIFGKEPPRFDPSNSNKLEEEP
jgi:ABC-type transporter Mla subunit MlaD